MTTVLLTGGSGFIGTFIARWLVANTDARVIALVRAKDHEEAIARLTRAWWDHPDLIAALDRIETVAGDVAEERLSLDHPTYDHLVKSVDIIIHAAADIRLDPPIDVLRRTNVDGTKNVLDLAEAVHRDHGLLRFAHLSTAYVAGGRTGPVDEEELSDQYGFLSNYEQSKYEGEKLVRERMSALPISIFRPGMVVGSSEDGYVRTFNTLYYPLRLYLNGKLRFLPISPFQPVNLVPVDYVADSIGRLIFDPMANGRTFHLVGDPAKLPTVRDVVDLTREWAAKNLGVELPHPIYLPAALGSGFVANGASKNLAPLAKYLYDKRQFQRSNMDERLGPYPVDWRQLLPKLLEFGTYTGFLHRSDRTVHEQVLFRLSGKSRPVRLFDIIDGTAIERPANDVRRDVLTAASALRSMGIGKGDRVAMVGANSTRYLTLDVALGLVGAVSVPLYYTSPPRELDEQIVASGARLLLIGSDQVMKRLGEMTATVPLISFCRSVPEELRDRVTSWEGFLSKGDGSASERSPVGFGDLATMRYTSSTTGRAKGVLYKHEHLRYMAESTASLPPWKVRNSEVFYLSFLPMNHVVEGILATYSPFYAPAPINLYFLEEFKGLRDALTKVRPTVFFSVPRFYERMHDTLMGSSIARGVVNNPKGIAAGFLASSIGRKALKRAGLDRCSYLISGSGYMSPAILKDLRALGIEVHNAYGLTEAPLVAINYSGRNRLGTVGEPLPRTEISISGEGEAMVRGPQVTCGYDNGEETPFRDGWLLTGDTGHITPEGSLVLDGRKKELIKTSYGKYVSPLKVEAMLRDLPGVTEAMLVGEGRPYVVALMWVEKSSSIKGLDDVIQDMSAQLSHPEQVKAWAFLNNDLSVDAGELTANMKLRRPKLVQRYSNLIDLLYKGGEESAEALHIGRAGRA